MLTDLRYALRALRCSPGFMPFAVLTLALGIGANTTVSSWMDGLVLIPFPTVRETSRSVSVKPVGGNGRTGSTSYPEFAAPGLYGVTAHSVTERTLESGQASHSARRRAR